jgi:hypothetical protein
MNDNDLMRRAIEFYRRSPDGQYDADVVRWLEELQRSRAPDQPAAVPTGAGGNARAFVCCEGVEQHKPGCTADQQSAAPQAIKGKSFDQFRDECREYAKQQSLPESGTSVPNSETRAAMEEARGFIQLLLPRCPNCQQPQGHGGPCSTTDKSKGDL